MLPVKRPSYWSPVKVAISVPAPRSSMISGLSSATSWLKRTQRKHEMQRSRSSAISDDRSRGFGKWRLVSTKRVVAGAELEGAVLQRALAALVAHRAVERVVLEQELEHAVLRRPPPSSELVRTTMSGCTGVLQAVCRPRMPSTSTRHMRHAPMGGAEARLVTEDRDLDAVGAGGVDQHRARRAR